MDGYLQNEPDPPPGSDFLAAHKIANKTGPKTANASTFSMALEKVEAFVVETFSQEIEQQQLYYHDWNHVNDVARRARLIFDTVVSCCHEVDQPPKQSAAIAWDRQRELLQLSAIAHDMLQIFSPQLSPHTPRQRQSGHSEKATIDKLTDFIEQLNQASVEASGSSPSQGLSPNALFSSADVAIIREAIEATVCQYDPVEGSIYQPLLYSQHREQKSLSLVAHCLALADIGTLGIDGLTAYTKEGGLLLMEENLDILAFLNNKDKFDDTFKENLRQRLLKRARFEVSFAKGRLARLDAELQGLPKSAITLLKRDVFKHLTPDTIHTIETITPTAEDTSLAELLDYFQLEDAL
ncbi:MAG: hypothetical protein ACFB0D_20850 [Phormidesmis sp.]